MWQAFFGLVFFLGVAWAFSECRGRIPWRTIVLGISLQLVLAGLLLNIAMFRHFFITLNGLLIALEEATRAGTAFVFGYLGGGELPFTEAYPGASFVLAFRALPLILVISALTSLFYYWRILPWLVQAMALILQKILGIGGALGLGAAANIFVGMVEAPLFVRPYLKDMTRSELFALMSCGMATIAGTMMVLYASIIGPLIPDAMGHILIASIISVPAALILAMVLVPPENNRAIASANLPQTAHSSLDALTQGTLQGIQLLINIIALLIVLVALVALVNMVLGVLPEFAGQVVTLQRLLGWIMAPVVWLIGIPWSEAQTAGALMGTKTILNEMLAYLEMSQLPVDALSRRSRIIMTYALCGFANLGSLGIMLGGLGTLVPERRAEIIALGVKAVIAGTLATLMTGAVVAIVMPT